MYLTYIIQITDHNGWTKSPRGFYNINQYFLLAGGAGVGVNVSISPNKHDQITPLLPTYFINDKL